MNEEDLLDPLDIPIDLTIYSVLPITNGLRISRILPEEQNYQWIGSIDDFGNLLGAYDKASSEDLIAIGKMLTYCQFVAYQKEYDSLLANRSRTLQLLKQLEEKITNQERKLIPLKEKYDQQRNY